MLCFLILQVKKHVPLLDMITKPNKIDINT